MLWAQRNDTVLLTIGVNDLHNEKYTINEKTLSFYGEDSQSMKYSFDIQFFKEVTPQVCLTPLSLIHFSTSLSLSLSLSLTCGVGVKTEQDSKRAVLCSEEEGARTLLASTIGGQYKGIHALQHSRMYVLL